MDNDACQWKFAKYVALCYPDVEGAVMKFTFLGVEYRIEFQYKTKKKGKRVRNYTFARIKTGDRDNEEIITEGRVVRYQYDECNKEHARKYALEAALSVSPLAGPEFRRAVHIAYHRRPGGLDYERAVNMGLIAPSKQIQKTVVTEA